MNTAVAFGLLESHGVTTSDAVRAYTQAKFKTKHRTFVLLPPELVPPGKKHINQPCAPLHKALYLWTTLRAPLIGNSIFMRFC